MARLVIFGIAVEECAEVAVNALPEWGFTRVSGAVYFHGVPLAESGDIGGLTNLSCHFSKRCRRWGSITTRSLSPIAKKEAHAGTPFRQGHRSVPDSHTGRLQLLTPDQEALYLRLDGLSDGRVTANHLVGHVA